MANKVIVDDRFAKYSRGVDDAIEKSLREAAVATADAARGASSPSGYNIGAIQAKTYPELATFNTRKGRGIVVINRDFRGLWFDKGTYLSRTNAISPTTRARRATSSGQARLSKWGGNQGVRPQHFMRRALTYGQKVLEARIRANLPG